MLRQMLREGTDMSSLFKIRNGLMDAPEILPIDFNIPAFSTSSMALFKPSLASNNPHKNFPTLRLLNS